MSSRRRRSVTGLRLVSKLRAVIFVSLLIALVFSGIVPVAAPASTESVALPDEYGAITTAINAVRAGDIDPSLDSDGDGISDYDEINGFTWENRTYFTNPFMASTDRDPYDDYMEITGINMPTAVRTPGRHPCVPSSPVLGIDLEGIDVTTLTTISATQTKEQGNTWSVVTETGWSINPEGVIEGGLKFDGKPEVGITGSGKISGEYHSKTTETTSRWSREEWSRATAVDTGEAAKLKLHVKIRNIGTDAAKNVKLRFNVMIGEECIVDTIWTDVVEWSINPDEVSEEMVISKDRDGNDIVVSLDELKSIEGGTPITITITEISAEVPWEGGWTTWNDYKGEIEPVSSNIMLDFGGGDAREYNAWAGLHLLAEPPHPTIHDITLWEAINRTMGVEDKENGIYISGKRLEKGWEFIFDNETAVEMEEKLEDLDSDWNLYDLLNLTIEPRWTLLVKAPDTEPPEIHWASYSADRKMILASVSDNVQVKNVTAHVKVRGSYADIELKDDDGDSIFTATLSEAITDTYDDYVIADDGTFASIWNDIRLYELVDWWPMFHHDARHTGYSTSSAPNDNHVLWKVHAGERIYSSPAVVNGKVFIISEDDVKYKIQCYYETNGTLIWESHINIRDKYVERRMHSSPTVADGMVFFGTNDNKLYCFDEDTGTKLGDFNIPFLSGWDIWHLYEAVTLTPATVVDGEVFFQAFHVEYATGGAYNYRTHMFCLGVDDGALTQQWEAYTGSWRKSDDIPQSKFVSSPAVANGRVFYGTYNGLVRCFTAGPVKDHKWNYDTGNKVFSSPAVADGMVFIGTGDGLTILNEKNGSFIWKSPQSDPYWCMISSYVYSTPAVSDGMVFIGNIFSDFYCYYFDFSPDNVTAEMKWGFDTVGGVISSPAVADGKVFVGSCNKLYCLDKDNGTLIWSYTTTGGDVLSSPAVANGKVFVGSTNGNLYCFGPPGLNPPTATISAISPATAMQGEDTVTFEGEGTDNGALVEYLWTSNIDGVICAGTFNFTMPSFIMPASDLSVGTHSIFFTVKDDDELWSTQEVGYVTVTAPNSPPVVTFNSSPDAPFIDEAVTFNASDSYDPDDFIKRYTWDFGDGTTATGKVVTHAYPEAGNYNVTLNVTDYYGLTNETTQTASVYHDYVYINEVGVTSILTVDSPSTLAPFLPDEYNDTDISHGIVFNVNVTDSTPGNGTDDAYVDITMSVGDMDVETCKVFKAGFGFLPEVDDVTALPAVSGNASFARDVTNETITVRLYVGDPLLGVVPPEETEPTPTPTPTPTPPPGGGGGGGGGASLDSDGDGYLDIMERLMDTDPNDPCDPDTESHACVALISKATPTPTPAAITPVPAPVPTPTPTVTPVGGEKEAEHPEEPGFEAIFAIGTLLAVAYAVLRRNSRRLS